VALKSLSTTSKPPPSRPQSIPPSGPAAPVDPPADRTKPT
jgi:hypothetical protein